MRQDSQAVGLLLLETVILALTEDKDATAASFVERLVMEIFRDDFAGLRYHDCRLPSFTSLLVQRLLHQ